MSERPGLLSDLLALVDEVTRPGGPPPGRATLDRLRDAWARLEEAEFISLAHEARRGLDLRPIAHEARAVGGVLPSGVTREDLSEVDEAWGIARANAPAPAGAWETASGGPRPRARTTPSPAARSAGNRSPKRIRTARDP